jgi:hypothetical protein
MSTGPLKALLFLGGFFWGGVVLLGNDLYRECLLEMR